MLDEIVRDGVRQMLAVEVLPMWSSSPIRSIGVVTGWWLRNVYHGERQVVTAAKAVVVRKPRINDRWVTLRLMSGSGYLRDAAGVGRVSQRGVAAAGTCMGSQDPDNAS